jgi:hypothetical protein
LRLAAGALEEHDELPCDCERDVGAEVIFDERECEVDAGGDSGGGPHVAVADENRIWFHLNIGVRRGESVAVLPVCGRAAIVEQAGGCE